MCMLRGLTLELHTQDELNGLNELVNEEIAEALFSVTMAMST